MKPTRIVSLVIGSLLALVGFGLVAGGGVLGWALATKRDAAGYFTTASTARPSHLNAPHRPSGSPGHLAWGPRRLPGRLRAAVGRSC